MNDEQDRLRAALADRYAIDRPIGSGGMATVYRADDLRHGRKVAVKVLRPALAAAIGADRFLAEIRVTASLQHPNILPLYDSGDANGLLYYVMPLVEGESLRDRIAREKILPIDQAIEIIRTVALALDFAHSRGVIHRDIKPENILLQHGQALVADFGIALAVSVAGGPRLTETGMSLGTPHYMSPEQALGDRDLDARSDVYALGAMLFEMLTGRPPFAAATAQGIIAKIVAEPAAQLTSDRKAVPRNVNAAVQVALEKLPADRFATAGAFADALGNPAFTAPSRTGDGHDTARERSWKERLAVPALLLAAAAGVLAGWALLKPNPQPLGVLRYKVSLPPQQALSTRYASRIALAPDGSRLVFVGPSPQGIQLWLQNRDQLEATPIPGTEGAAAPFFSPDGQQVGFLNVGRQSLHAVSLESGALTTLVPSGVRRVGAAWGRDGIVYVDEQRGLVSLLVGQAPAAATVLLSLEKTRDPKWPQILPGGKGVLFSRSAAEGAGLSEIAAISGAGAEPRTLVHGVVGVPAPRNHLLYVTATGELSAAAVDYGRLELRGAPVVVAQGLELQFDAVDLALSGGGTLIYGTRTAEQELSKLVWTDRDGTMRVLDPNWEADFQSLALSPDGRRLAVTVISGGQKLDVWMKPMAGGPPARLTLENERSFRPSWHPTGRTVGLIVQRGETRQFFTRQADGSGGTQLGFSQTVNQAEWSHDGKWLIYRTGIVDDLNIFARRLQDTATIPLAATPNVNEHSPALSSDGKWLAFMSNKSGIWDVYVRPFPNAGDGEWQVSTGGGTEPRWAHNSRELFYKQGGQFMVAELVAGPAFAVGQRRALFPLDGYYNFAFHPTYDVAPDDKSFVMIRSPHLGEFFNLVVVENWAAELNPPR